MASKVQEPSELSPPSTARWMQREKQGWVGTCSIPCTRAVNLRESMLARFEYLLVLSVLKLLWPYILVCGLSLGSMGFFLGAGGFRPCAFCTAESLGPTCPRVHVFSYPDAGAARKGTRDVSNSQVQANPIPPIGEPDQTLFHLQLSPNTLTSISWPVFVFNLIASPIFVMCFWELGWRVSLKPLPLTWQALFKAPNMTDVIGLWAIEAKWTVFPGHQKS